MFLFLAAIAITIGGIRSISRADALVIHGPSGWPAALVTCRGVLYLGVCDAPIWSLQQSPVDLRHFSITELREYRDTMVLAANRQFGYELSPGAKVMTMSAWMNQNGINQNSTTQTYNVSRIWAGFSIGKGTDALGVPGKWFVFASVPVWAAVPVLLVIPVRRMSVIVRQRRRAKRGQCLACGYDLRESVGRCPECGIESNRVH